MPNLEKLARNIYNFVVINNGIEKVMDMLKLEEDQDIDINRQMKLHTIVACKGVYIFIRIFCF